MKANFNITKNVRNSRSINALGALRKLQSLGLLLCALMIGSLQVWGADVTGLIEFGSGTGKTQINSASVTGDDSQDNTWTITTVGTTSFTSNSAYYQVGSSSKPATSITFTTTLPSSQTITSFSAKFGGFSGTAGTITLKVGDTSVGSGSLSATSDVTVTNSSNGTGTVLTVTVTGISKGVKCYYISYTYSSGPTLYTVTFDANGGSVSPASATQASAGAAISLPTPTRAGFNCTGWYTATSGGTKRGNAGGSYTPTASETIHAQWSAKTYSNYRTLCTPASDPSITVSPASITNLDYIVGQGPSAAQNITLGGSNLTAGITITAPTNFEVSTDGGSTYGDSRTVTQTGGEPDVTTVKVRLKADRAVNTYGSSNVTFESTGATTQNVAVTGHVFKPLIEADPSPVSWSTSVGVAPSKTSVSVTGTNLKANITAVKGGTNASDFTISPASITQTSGSASGSITITYTGAYNAVTTKTATLTLSSTDADDVVVNITFNVIVDPNLYFLTDLEDIGPKDKVIIVSYKDAGGVGEEDRALPSYPTYTKDPASVDVKSGISGNRQTLTYSGTALQWNIIYNSSTGQFTANQYGGSDVKLACKDDNAGVQLGTTYTNTTFTLATVEISSVDYLYIKNIETGRFLGVYNSDKWKCYNPINSNIYYQDVAFYVQPSTDPYVTLGSSFSEFTYEYNHGPSSSQTFTVSGEHLAANLVVTAPANYQVSKNGSSDWGSSVSYTPSTGTVSEQTVYIRLVGNLAVGTYNYAQASGLSVTSTGADAVKVALTGSVTPESFTVTATSSNVSHGTVSPASQSTTTNMTITASPVDGYRVVSGAGGYTVTVGTASVMNNGDNTFTVTPSTDCTVRINFEAIPTHKVAYWATGTKIQESDVQEGAAIPDQTTETTSGIEAYCGNRDHFVGWTTNSSYSHATDAPAGMITSMSPGGTMSTSDVNYYAVYANTGGTSNNYSRVTDLSQLSDGDVVIIVSGSANQFILQQTASGVQSGGTRTATTSFTDNTAANHWTLEAGTGDDAGKWRLLKDASNKLTSLSPIGYSAYGNALIIEDAVSDDFYFIRSGSSSYLEYYSGWKFWSTDNPTANNANIRNAIYKQDPGYVDYTTQCCSLLPVTGVTVSASTNNSVTLSWTLPASTTGITKFQVIDVDNANNVVKDNISTSATTASITSLTKCNTYHYKVVSYSSTCTVSSATVEARPYGDTKTVTFNYNGGSGSPASFTTSCVAGESTTLPTPDARDGYTFLGWYSAQNGGNPIGAAGASYTVTGNTTIWAHWAQNYTVTYDLNGGSADPVCSGGTYYVGQTVTVCSTTPTKLGYNFTGWSGNNGVGTKTAGQTFTMPSGNVTLTAQWAENNHTVTYSIPTGGGDAIANATVLDGHTIASLPNITNKSGDYWCYTFVGWTTEAPIAAGADAGKYSSQPTTYAAGSASPAITDNTTLYAVYSKGGAGASGTVSLSTATIEDLYTEHTDLYVNPPSNTNIAYGSQRCETEDGNEWCTTGQQTNGGKTYIQLKNQTGVWIKLPTVGGAYNSVTITCNSIVTARTFTYRTSADGSDLASGSIASYGTSGTIDLSEVGTTSGYLYNPSGNVINVESISASYGPPTVYSHALTEGCGCQVTQFDLTYDANTANFPGSTISCSNEDDYVFASHSGEYTFCSAPTPPSGYRFLYWVENANGSGNHWDAGETVTCLPNNNLTVYAWYERVYTVTFNDQGTVTNATQAAGGASVAVPSHTTPCVMSGATWEFAGWSKTGGALAESLTATIDIAANATEYTPIAADDGQTFYAVYKKTSDPGSAFSVGKTGFYKFYYTCGGKDYYACNNQDRGIYANHSGQVEYYFPQTFHFVYYPTGTYAGKYTIQRADGKYIGYAGSDNNLQFSESASSNLYYWTISTSSDGFIIQNVNTTSRYLNGSCSSGTGGNFNAKTSNDCVLKFTSAGSVTYFTNMACTTIFSITFDDGGGTINWTDGYPQGTYEDVPDGTIFTTFPTASSDGWAFIGWTAVQGYSDMSKYSSGRDATTGSGVVFPDASDIYSTGGNSYTIHSNVTMYPLFTRFEDNEPFDETNGGDYFIYFIESGSDDGYGNEKRVYAATYDGEKRYNSAALCDNATTFTFTKLGNGNWTIYDNTTHKYLYGIADDWIKQQDGTSGAEWTLTVHSGNQFDAYHVGTSYGQLMASGNGTSATFMNYSRVNISNPTYHRVYLGGCTNRVFSSNPTTVPSITVNGTVRVTSTANKSVKASNPLTVSAKNIETANLTVTSDNSAFKFCLTQNGTYTASLNIPVVSHRVNLTPVYVSYTPAAGSTSDGIDDAIITVSDGAVEPTTASTESGDVQGRHLPAKFLIATKIGGDWYALPNNMSAYGNPDYVKLSSVNEATGEATYYSDEYEGEAVGSKNYLTWTLNSVVNTNNADYGYPQHGNRVRFYDSKNSKYLEVKASDDDIKNSIASPSTSDHPLCEFLPTTTDLIDYTLKNEGQVRYLGVDGGKWGDYTSSTTVRFLIPNQQPAPTITWQNNMLSAVHATNTAENGVVTLPTGADPVSCNTTLFPTFCGWSATEPSGSYWTSAPSYITAGTVATENTTYYAVFKDATRNRWYTQCPTYYTLTFNRGTGTGDDYVAYTENTTYVMPDAATTGHSKEGYTLSGWTTTVNVTVGGNTITAGNVIGVGSTISGISGDMTFTAVWTGNIAITGNVWLTSYNGVTVYATSTTNNLITVSSADATGATRFKIIYLDGNGDEVAKGSSRFRLCNNGSSNYNMVDASSDYVTVSTTGAYSQTYSISYTPNAHNTINTGTLKLQLMRNSTVLSEATLVLHGRALPQEFVVASKFDGEWYALPNTLEPLEANAKAVAGVKITVDNSTTPTAATYAPDITVYQGEGRYVAGTNVYGIRLTDGTNHLQVSTTNSKNVMWLSPTGSSNCQDWWLSSTNFGAYSVTLPSNTGNETKKIGMYGGDIGYYASPTSPSEQIYFLPITNKLVDNPASVTEWAQKSVILDVDAQTASSAQARLGSGEPEEVASFAQTLTSVKGNATKYNYTLSFNTLDFSAHKGELLYIDWLDGSSNVLSTSAITIPWIIATNSVMGSIDNVQAHWKDWEVHVLPGVTLEANGSAFASSTAKVRSLEIYPGATVKVTSGTLDVAQDLVLRYGWTRAGEKSYDVAQLQIKRGTGGANLTTNHVYADWYIDYDQYYPISVPWNVTVANITYKNSNSAASAGMRLRYYDGESRAANGQTGVDIGANWKEYSPLPTTLEPSKGYALTAKRPSGKAFSILRMPLTIPNSSWTALGEQGEVSSVHKDQVSVTGYGLGSSEWYAMGWNFIGNPYMSTFNGDDEGISGKLELQNGGSIRYATIPDQEFKNYYQVNIAEANLKPASGFFVQANNADPQTITFAASQIVAPSAPARYAEKEETIPEQEAYIRLSNEDDIKDQMGLIIGDNYTAEYEPNADLVKVVGEANALKTYMHYIDMDMAYVAINETLAKEWIPVTVHIPSSGDYTFSLTNSSVVEHLEGVYLIDYKYGMVTNLIGDTYSFRIQEGVTTDRFAINAIIDRRDTPTDIGNVQSDEGQSTTVMKFLYRDKMYILRHGVLYDATGKKVK